MTQQKIEHGILQFSPVSVSLTTTLTSMELAHCVRAQAILGPQPTTSVTAVLLKTSNGETLPLPVSAETHST